MVFDCWTPVWRIVLVGLLVGGCTVFEGSPLRSNDVDTLLADARTALAAGNPDRAVRLLKRAYEIDSTDVRVRVELGNALYSKQGLDVFALRDAVNHLVDSTQSSSASVGGASAGERGKVCTEGAAPAAAPDRYEQISVDAAPLRRFADHASVVARVRELVVEGVLSRRPAAFDAAKVSVRRTGYLVATATVVAGSLLSLRSVVRTTGSTLYLDRAAQPTQGLVACAKGDRRLARTHDALCALSDAADRGVHWLRARLRLSERGEGAILAGPLQTLANAARARKSCG